MKAISGRQSGSALLIILLIMGIAGVLALSATRLLLSSTRLANRLSSADLAEQMAWSALEEGLLRENNPGSGALGLVSGEYGQGAVANPTAGAAYSLLPLRRGFARGSNCQTLLPDQSPDSSNYDQDCPYADLTVRHMVNFSSSSPQNFGYSKRELPNGVTVTLPIYNYTPFTLSPSSGFVGSIDYSMNGAPSCAGSSTGFLTISLTTCSGATALSLTVHGALPDPTMSNPGLLVTLSGSGNLVIDKGYTTLEAAGYAGGVVKRLVIYNRSHDGFLAAPYASSQNVLQTATGADRWGFPQ